MNPQAAKNVKLNIGTLSVQELFFSIYGVAWGETGLLSCWDGLCHGLSYLRMAAHGVTFFAQNFLQTK